MRSKVKLCHTCELTVDTAHVRAAPSPSFLGRARSQRSPPPAGQTNERPHQAQTHEHSTRERYGRECAGISCELCLPVASAQD